MKNGKQRLVEDWSGDDDETSLFMGDGGGHSQQASWCRKCSAAGRMSGRERESWSRSGYCDTPGCPGYSGHPPASRPQGEFRLEVTAHSCAGFNCIRSLSGRHSNTTSVVNCDLACGLWCGEVSHSPSTNKMIVIMTCLASHRKY